jgi:hypothetical protein
LKTAVLFLVTVLTLASAAKTKIILVGDSTVNDGGGWG